MWGDAAKMSYSPSNTPDYVKNIAGPMRKYYVNKEKEARELLLYNVQVREIVTSEGQIAIFFPAKRC